MPKLPILRWVPATTGSADRLERWCSAWGIDQHLRVAQPGYADPLPFAARGGSTDDPLWQRLADPDVADLELDVGQIRLIDGWLVPKARRLVFVAIIYAWEGGVFAISPYGPFNEPATTGELLTDRPDDVLQVLSLWNTRAIPHDLLSEGSRFVGRLTLTELSDARAVFRHALTGESLPETLRDRVGSPIIHHRDPRIVYQSEEAQMLNIVLSCEQHGTQIPFQLIDEPDRWAIAAAPLAEVRVAEFHVPGQPAQISVHYDRVNSRRWLVVWDSPPRHKPSSILDGWRVLVQTNPKTGFCECGVIGNCGAELPLDGTEWYLRSTNGTEFIPRPIGP